MRVYNNKLEYIYRLRDFQALTVNRRYTGTGTARLTLAAGDAGGYYLQKNHFLLIDDEPYVVKHIEQGLERTLIQAYSCHVLLDQRLTGKGELKNEQIVSVGSADAVVKDFINRSKGDLPITTKPDQPDQITVRDVTRLKKLGEEVQRVLDLQGRGERFSIEDNILYFDTYKGEDKSLEVVFSADMGNLDEMVYTETSVDDKTTIYIGGAGEGAGREMAIVGGEAEGLDRIEVFSDARDVDEGDTEELINRAEQLLTSTEKAITATLMEGDYNLGDLVTIRFVRPGLEENTAEDKTLDLVLRITQETISRQDGEEHIDLQFGTIPLIDSDPVKELRKKMSQMETAETPLERITEQVKTDLEETIIGEVEGLNEFANALLGLYTTKVTLPDDSKIIYSHDEPNLEDSSFIAIKSGGAFAWTTTGWNDGHPAWQYGVDQTGNAIFRLISTVGLNANWINAGKVKAEHIEIGPGADFEEGYDPTEKVEIDTTYKGVKINETDGFVSTATIGGKTATVKLNSVDGLAFYDGATYRGGLGVRDSQLSLLTDVLGTASDPNHFLKFATYQPWEGPFPDEKGTRLEFHNKGYMSSTIYKSAQMESFGYPWGGVFHIVAPGDSPHMALWVGERSPYGEDFTTHLILDKDNNANNAMFSLNAASADFYNSTTITGISTHDPNSEGYIAFHVDGTLVGSMEADRLWMLQEIEMENRVLGHGPEYYMGEDITDISNAPFKLPHYRISGNPKFLPFGHMESRHQKGYNTHLAFGLWKGNIAWDAGMFVGLGGNDSYPTRYFLFHYDGSISHSSLDIKINGDYPVLRDLSLPRYTDSKTFDAMYKGGIVHKDVSGFSLSGNYYAGYETGGNWYKLKAGYADDAGTLGGTAASGFLKLTGGTMTGGLVIDYSASNINYPSILLKRSGHDDWKIHMGYGDFNISSNTTGSTYSTFHVAHNAAVGIGMRPNENYAGSLSLTGRIIGSTSNTWITATRIGLGVAANSNYTVDAGSGYIRGGKFYSGSSAGLTRTLRVKNTLGQDVNANFTGGILTSVTSP